MWVSAGLPKPDGVTELNPMSNEREKERERERERERI